MTGPRAVIDHVVAAISPASEAQAAGARMRLGIPAAGAPPSGAGTTPGPEPGSLAELAVRLAAARHAPAPRTARKALVVVLGDHGCADPGVDLGDAHPAVVAARAIDGGDAAVAVAARAAGARVVLVDAGVATRAALPASVVALGGGRRGGDVTREPAMTPVDALLAIQAGIALGTALADDGLDVLALGHVAPGAEVASAAVIAMMTGLPAVEVAALNDLGDIAAALATHVGVRDPIEVLAAVGGPDLALLCGLILSAASGDVAVVLDDHGTAAAALAAARLAPAVPGYLIAAHGGTRPAHRRALAALGLAPLFSLGLGSGEGTGAVLALGLIEGAARLLST